MSPGSRSESDYQTNHCVDSLETLVIVSCGLVVRGGKLTAAALVLLTTVVVLHTLGLHVRVVGWSVYMSLSQYEHHQPLSSSIPIVWIERVGV